MAIPVMSMKKKYRDGRLVEQDNGQDRFLSRLYGSLWGRALLKPLTAPALSRLAGAFLSSGLSRGLIAPFIRKNNIDMSEYLPCDYPSYNAFFTRAIRPDARPMDPDPTHLISPCDSKLTVLPITEDLRFTIKHTEYNVASLLQDAALADRYAGGQLLLFRLTVDDYHRYCYVADGEKGENRFIPGVLHTVNPIANDHFPIYKQNCREYSLLTTKEFGTILMMEVGALMVGKIVNHHAAAAVCRGQEKGYFQFGGSTVILLLPVGAAQIDADILENSAQGIETVVKLGEKIGVSLLSSVSDRND